MILIYIPVCQDQDIRSLTDDSVYFDEQIFNGFFQARILIISDRDLCNFESVPSFMFFDLQKIGIGQDRVIYLSILQFSSFCSSRFPSFPM